MALFHSCCGAAIDQPHARDCPDILNMEAQMAVKRPSHRHGSPRTERGESTGPKPSYAVTLENIVYSMRPIMDNFENDPTTRDIAQAIWELAQIMGEVKDG